MAQKIFLVQDRFDFPQLLIPVFEKVTVLGQVGGKFPPYELSLNLDKKLGLDGANVDWRDQGEFYWGGSNVYSDKVGFNRIVGVDDIELYITSDGYADFYDEEHGTIISDSGAITTACSDVQVVTSVEIEPVKYGIAGFAYKLDSAFNKGSKLVSKYPFRKGNFVRGYGVRNLVGPAHVGVLILVPPKRDLEATIIKVFSATTALELAEHMTLFECAVDPTFSKYSQKYVSTFEIGNEMATCGFLVSSAHLTLFEYDAKCSIAGMSMHSDEED